MTTSVFDPFDFFVLIFTVIIALGFYRLLMAKERNLFALGFAGISLFVFLFMDGVMVLNWLGFKV